MAYIKTTEQYTKLTLSKKDLAKNPIAQFENWLAIAQKVDAKFYNAMTLATSDNGQPQARIVLLKKIDNNGFIFFSNNDSTKGKAITANNKVALLFFWNQLERQVRIEGNIEILDASIARDYYYQRNLNSQYSCFVSNQSQVVADRKTLETKVAKLAAEYPQQAPYKNTWTGYKVEAQTLEFWQGRDNRLHDRFLYTKTSDGWAINRLQP